MEVRMRGQQLWIDPILSRFICEDFFVMSLVSPGQKMRHGKCNQASMNEHQCRIRRDQEPRRTIFSVIYNPSVADCYCGLTPVLATDMES
jgi:hypothetical protein